MHLQRDGEAVVVELVYGEMNDAKSRCVRTYFVPTSRHVCRLDIRKHIYPYYPTPSVTFLEAMVHEPWMTLNPLMLLPHRSSS